MTIANDLADVFEEVGVRFVVDNTGIEEYMDYEFNAQVSNPFIREFAINVILKASTQVESGTVITIPKVNQRFLIVSYLPEFFENEVVCYNSTIYKCNVYGYIYRQVEVDSANRYDSSYKTDFEWSLVTELYAPFTTDIRGISSGLDSEEDDTFFVNVKSKNLYLPESLDVRVDDRWLLSPDTFFKIENVEKHRFNNVLVCDVSEDNRGGSYATGEEPS